ncbi:MAG: M14 family zinc carboxypeptidase [Arcticibacter sp.]
MHVKRYDFDRYKDQSFENRFVRHADVRKLVQQSEEKGISVSVLGASAEKREIFRLSLGSGKIVVLLWSQMHGDESTATMAIFDVLSFLTSDDEENRFRSMLLQACTFYFIPMLNPDGAERWQRRNAQGIDINRDSLALQSPEARILKTQRDLLQPAFAFNLHDQDSVWSVTGSLKPALISLLAPPAKRSLEFTPSMRRAVQIIAGLYEQLELEIPGNTGRWKDEYEPRAAGETFQEAGVSTILVESGGYSDEATKQYVRKLNFDVLIDAFGQIASGETLDEGAAMEVYRNVPLNTKEIFHIILRNCRLSTAAGLISVDIALNHEAIDEQEQRTYLISDLGDLSTFSAYKEIDAEGAELCGGSTELNVRANFRLSREEKIIIFEEGTLKEYNFEG